MHHHYDSAYFEQPWVSKTDKAADAYVRLLERELAGPARILDVGCGTGTVLARLCRNPRWQCFGVDVSAEAVARSKRVTDSVQVADATTLPFPERYFDALLILDVLEHVEAPVLVLREARRVTKDGGIVILSTPNAGSILRIVLGRKWHGFADASHLYFFTKFTLSHLLRTADWRPTRAETFSGAPFGLGPVLRAAGVGGELCVVARAT